MLSCFIWHFLSREDWIPWPKGSFGRSRFGLQTAIGQNRGLSFGYMSLKRGSFSSLHKRRRKGNLEGELLYRNFERQVKEGSENDTPLPMGALRGEPGGRASLLEYLKYILKGAVTTVICLHRDPVGGTWRDSFTWNIEIQAKSVLETESLSLWDLEGGLLYKGP